MKPVDPNAGKVPAIPGTIPVTTTLTPSGDPLSVTGGSGIPMGLPTTGPLAAAPSAVPTATSYRLNPLARAAGSVRDNMSWTRAGMGVAGTAAAIWGLNYMGSEEPDYGDVNSLPGVRSVDADILQGGHAEMVNHPLMYGSEDLDLNAGNVQQFFEEFFESFKGHEHQLDAACKAVSKITGQEIHPVGMQRDILTGAISAADVVLFAAVFYKFYGLLATHFGRAPSDWVKKWFYGVTGLMVASRLSGDALKNASLTGQSMLNPDTWDFTSDLVTSEMSWMWLKLPVYAYITKLGYPLASPFLHVISAIARMYPVKWALTAGAMYTIGVGGMTEAMGQLQADLLGLSVGQGFNAFSNAFILGFALYTNNALQPFDVSSAPRIVSGGKYNDATEEAVKALLKEIKKSEDDNEVVSYSFDFHNNAQNISLASRNSKKSLRNLLAAIPRGLATAVENGKGGFRDTLASWIRLPGDFVGTDATQEDIQALQGATVTQTIKGTAATAKELEFTYGRLSKKDEVSFKVEAKNIVTVGTDVSIGFTETGLSITPVTGEVEHLTVKKKGSTGHFVATLKKGSIIIDEVRNVEIELGKDQPLTGPVRLVRGNIEYVRDFDLDQSSSAERAAFYKEFADGHFTVSMDGSAETIFGSVAQELSNRRSLFASGNWRTLGGAVSNLVLTPIGYVANGLLATPKEYFRIKRPLESLSALALAPINLPLNLFTFITRSGTPRHVLRRIFGKDEIDYSVKLPAALEPKTQEATLAALKAVATDRPTIAKLSRNIVESVSGPVVDELSGAGKEGSTVTFRMSEAQFNESFAPAYLEDAVSDKGALVLKYKPDLIESAVHAKRLADAQAAGELLTPEDMTAVEQRVFNGKIIKSRLGANRVEIEMDGTLAAQEAKREGSVLQTLAANGYGSKEKNSFWSNLKYRVRHIPTGLRQWATNSQFVIVLPNNWGTSKNVWAAKPATKKAMLLPPGFAGNAKDFDERDEREMPSQVTEENRQAEKAIMDARRRISEHSAYMDDLGSIIFGGVRHSLRAPVYASVLAMVVSTGIPSFFVILGQKVGQGFSLEAGVQSGSRIFPSRFGNIAVTPAQQVLAGPLRFSVADNYVFSFAYLFFWDTLFVEQTELAVRRYIYDFKDLMGENPGDRDRDAIAWSMMRDEIAMTGVEPAEVLADLYAFQAVNMIHSGVVARDQGKYRGNRHKQAEAVRLAYDIMQKQDGEIGALHFLLYLKSDEAKMAAIASVPEINDFFESEFEAKQSEIVSHAESIGYTVAAVQ